MTAPEDDRPVGEVPPTWAGLFGIDPTFPAPDSTTDPRTWQALLTQLHEARAEVERLRRSQQKVAEKRARVRRERDAAIACANAAETREAALRAGIEGLVPCADVLLAAQASWGGWAHEYVKLSHSLRALLDGEARP